ncbi:MAG: hypothetical protein JXR77_03335, partial [Lentisphaeria bacterium]|nr:hypothetical protein [Lentisphaeria bacterium]
MTMKQLAFTTVTFAALTGAFAEEATDRAKGRRLEKDGNFAEAYTIYRRLVSDRRSAATEVPDDLVRAVQCLQRL